MSGFHQIELEKSSRYIASFLTSNGSFQRVMTIAFSGLDPSQAFKKTYA